MSGMPSICEQELLEDIEDGSASEREMKDRRSLGVDLMGDVGDVPASVKVLVIVPWDVQHP